MKALEDLDVQYSNWGDVSGLFAGEFPSLKKLNMRDCYHLKTDSMESIGMTALEDLDVEDSNWGDVSGLFAGELPSLKKLNMEGCKNLKTDSMESIGMRALEDLNVNASNLSGNEDALSLIATKLPSLNIRE